MFLKAAALLFNAPPLLAARKLTNICHCIFQHILPCSDSAFLKEKQDAHLFFTQRFFSLCYKAYAPGCAEGKKEGRSYEEINVFHIYYIVY